MSIAFTAIMYTGGVTTDGGAHGVACIQFHHAGLASVLPNHRH